jgi:hypothetical protein
MFKSRFVILLGVKEVKKLKTIDVLGRTCPINELGGHEIGFGTRLGMLVDIIWEKENLQNSEDNDEFDDDNSPEGLPQRHVAEAVVVEVNCPI